VAHRYRDGIAHRQAKGLSFPRTELHPATCVVLGTQIDSDFKTEVLNCRDYRVFSRCVCSTDFQIMGTNRNSSDEFADDVRADELEAQEAGFTGVPTMVVDGRFAIPGAQPPDVLVRLLSRVMENDRA